MLRATLSIAFGLFLIGSVAAAEAPRRIVSLNLCADQYLLALADRDQIAALTKLATDPGMSAMAKAAESLPQIAGAAEEVIGLDPDLVIGGTFSLRQTRSMLERMGYPMISFAPDESFESIRKTTRRLAKAVGHPERGERLVSALDHVLEQYRRPLGRPAPSALYYQRRGYANGGRSLVSEIMAAAGLRNLAVDLGLEHTGRVELESVVAARPDYLLVDSRSPRVDDQGSYMLRHPALARAVPPGRRLVLPRSLVICGGPMTAEAVRVLAEQVRSTRENGAALTSRQR